GVLAGLDVALGHHRAVATLRGGHGVACRPRDGAFHDSDGPDSSAGRAPASRPGAVGAIGPGRVPDGPAEPGTEHRAVAHRLARTGVVPRALDGNGRVVRASRSAPRNIVVTAPLLSVRNLAVQIRGRQILRGVSFDVRAGQTLGVAGANGA